MNTKITFPLCLFVIILLQVNCREAIEFEVEETLKNTLVIQGKLIKGEPSKVEVKIGEVFDLSTNPSLLLAEFVQIIDDANNNLDLQTKQQGVFNLDIPKNHPNFKVDYGRAYKIRLQLKNGDFYESTFDTLYPVPQMEELKIGKKDKTIVRSDGLMQTQEIVIFSINTSFFPPTFRDKARLLWEYEGVYKQTDSPPGSISSYFCRPQTNIPKTCYVRINPVDNYKSLNTKRLSGDRIEDFVIYEANNSRSFVFSEGYYLTVYQQSLSETAFTYWNQVTDLTNRDGTIFKVPANQIVSNWQNIDASNTKVFGLFFATESVQKRIYVSPSFAGNPPLLCPSKNLECVNCLCQEQSTTEKPKWWIE